MFLQPLSLGPLSRADRVSVALVVVWLCVVPVLRAESPHGALIPLPAVDDAGAPRNSYAGCHHDAEAPIDEDNHGLLFLNSRVRYSDIFDGAAEEDVATRLAEPAVSAVSGFQAADRSTLIGPQTALGPKQTCVDPTDVMRLI